MCPSQFFLSLLDRNIRSHLVCCLCCTFLQVSEALTETLHWQVKKSIALVVRRSPKVTKVISSDLIHSSYLKK
jgi:hypothetical protein